MWGNTLAINGVLKKKTTKLNFQPTQYEKKKFDKDNFGKKSIKKHVRKHCSKKKNHVGKYCSNPQCFFSRKKLQN
jgi:hypothetical protein